jgi:RNA polymerase sigma factor (sigma-70 family)
VTAGARDAVAPGGEAPNWRAAESLVRQANAGDTLAMNALLDIAAPYVHRICRAVAPEQVDDATQEVLMVVFRRLRSLREPAALRGWLRTVAVREALRAAQGGHREQALGDRVDSVPTSASDPALAVELRESLGRLPPEQRAVLVLRDWEGLSEAEIAPLLGVATGTVKSRLHRARARFRREWRP